MAVLVTQLSLVAAGGALGASLRYATFVMASRLFGLAFPWGTLAVNVIGSLAMGLLVESAARKFGIGEGVKLFVATGLLGGFTTFSSFSLDAVSLFERGAPIASFVYVGSSVVLSIGALIVGLLIGRAIF